MIEKLIFEYHEMPSALFVLITLMSVLAAYLVKEISDRLVFGIVGFPLIMFFGILGHAGFRAANVQLGVDIVTDGVVAAAFGISIAALILVLFMRSMRLLRG